MRPAKVKENERAIQREPAAAEKLFRSAEAGATPRPRANAESGRYRLRAVSFCGGFFAQRPGDILQLLVLHQFKPAQGNKLAQRRGDDFGGVFKCAPFA